MSVKQEKLYFFFFFTFYDGNFQTHKSRENSIRTSICPSPSFTNFQQHLDSSLLFLSCERAQLYGQLLQGASCTSSSAGSSASCSVTRLAWRVSVYICSGQNLIHSLSAYRPFHSSPFKQMGTTVSQTTPAPCSMRPSQGKNPSTFAPQCMAGQGNEPVGFADTSIGQDLARK